MRTVMTSALAVLVLAAASSAQDLDRNQQQACDRQERNQKEAEKKLKELQDSFAADWEKMKPADFYVPPGWFKGLYGKGDDVLSKCEGIRSDLEKAKCPAENARVKALFDFCETAKAAVAKIKEETKEKYAEMEKLADPKNWPNLDADFKQIETLAKAYAMKGFKTHPDKVAELAAEFPRATQWASDTFKTYKPLIVLTGGEKSPLYKKYEAMAKSIKAFQAEASEFFKEAQAEVPALCKKAEEMADKAAAEKKAAYFTGGVKQQLDGAESYLKVCRGLVKADDERLQAMEDAKAASQKKIDAQAASLKELIIAETRPPAEKYSGGDKEDIRKAIAAEWKAAWPQDEILMIRLHMGAFDRRETATWDGGSKSWSFSDRSVLCVTVIVKTSDRIATSYPAYVNVDNIAKSTTYGVKTKGGIYVNEEMLVENVK